jgi:hypothetical protein
MLKTSTLSGSKHLERSTPIGPYFNSLSDMSSDSCIKDWPKNRLGMSTGLSSISGKELFCVMKAYYDGSTTEDESGEKWITFAGIAGTDAVWAEFDTRWARMLASRYPFAPYIHMIELLDDNDPFENHVGWCEERKRALLQDAVILLSQMNKAGFKMARVSIPESTRLRLETQGVTVPKDPYLHCAVDCVFMTAGMYGLNVEDETQEPLYIFFDRGEKFLGRFKNNHLGNRTRPGLLKTPDNWWDSFADVQDVGLAYHFGLQAADMIA